MHNKPTRLAALAAILMTATAPAGAELFTGGVDNNWFDSGNWDGGQVPNSTLDARIEDGFEVTATAADAGGSTVETNALELSRDSGDGVINSLTSEVDVTVTSHMTVGKARNAGGDFSGQLFLSGADLEVSAILEIGSNSRNLATTASGTVRVENGSVSPGDQLTIAQNFQGGGDVNGSLEVINGDLGIPGSIAPWQVALSTGTTGAAVGSLRLENGTLSQGGSFNIGVATGSGTANGEVVLVDSDGDVGRTTLAFGNNGTGRIELDQSFLSIDELILDDGATLAFGLGGTTRAATAAVGAGTYAAIDITDTGIIVDLVGVLELLFDFSPSADVTTFDLIALGAGSTFSGDFDSFNVAGLAGGYNAQYEIVAGSGGNGEILRLTAQASAPSPATAALLLPGLLLAGLLKRARQQKAQQRRCG